MYSGYMNPFYRGWGIGYPGYGVGYPTWGFGGVGGAGGFGGFGGYGSYGGINSIGSAIANQSIVNTGSVIGLTQTATPTVVW